MPHAALFTQIQSNNEKKKQGNWPYERWELQFFNYLIGIVLSCHLLQRPSSMKYDPHVPCCALLRLQSRTPKKKQDNWLCKWWVLRVFYLVNYLIWNVALTCLLLQWPSSTNYIHYASHCTLPWLQPNTKITQRDDWPCKWWVLRMFIFPPLFILIWPSWHAIFCHPLIYESQTPCRALPCLQFKANKKKLGNWPHQWWVLWLLFCQLLNWE
jgi:hypothetical protein